MLDFSPPRFATFGKKLWIHISGFGCGLPPQVFDSLRGLRFFRKYRYFDFSTG
jgi:hypothetical protein